MYICTYIYRCIITHTHTHTHTHTYILFRITLLKFFFNRDKQETDLDKVIKNR